MSHNPFNLITFAHLNLPPLKDHSNYIAPNILWEALTIGAESLIL